MMPATATRPVIKKVSTPGFMRETYGIGRLGAGRPGWQAAREGVARIDQASQISGPRARVASGPSALVVHSAMMNLAAFRSRRPKQLLSASPEEAQHGHSKALVRAGTLRASTWI